MFLFRVTLRITVKDINNHAPEFDNPWYTFTVEEGKQPDVQKLMGDYIR